MTTVKQNVLGVWLDVCANVGTAFCKAIFQIHTSLPKLSVQEGQPETTAEYANTVWVWPTYLGWEYPTTVCSDVCPARVPAGLKAMTSARAS